MIVGRTRPSISGIMARVLAGGRHISPTTNEIRRLVKQFITSDLIRDPDYPLQDDTTLFSSGLVDSFALAELGVFIDRKFGVYVPDSELSREGMDTLERIVRRVLQGLRDESD